MPTQVQHADLVNGRGAVHKATDLVQPSWRAADVDVRTVRRDVEEFVQSNLRSRPIIFAASATAMGLGVGLLAGWFWDVHERVANPDCGLYSLCLTQFQTCSFAKGISMTKQIDTESSFGTLGDRLPQESRESLEQLLADSGGYLRRARTYVTENPVEAAGVAVIGAGLLWALFATKPGRRIVDAGKAFVIPAVGGLVSNLVAKAGAVGQIAATETLTH